MNLQSSVAGAGLRASRTALVASALTLSLDILAPNQDSRHTSMREDRFYGPTNSSI